MKANHVPSSALRSEVELPLLPGECWWGGLTQGGVHRPYGTAEHRQTLGAWRREAKRAIQGSCKQAVAALTTAGSRLQAFTSVEMLVATVILTVLIMSMAQVTISAIATTTSNRNQMESDAIARMVFDRMAGDIASMVKRKDVDCVCKEMAADMPMEGDDRLFFFGEAPAFFSGTATSDSVALLGYRISSNSPYFPNTPVLERLSKGLPWDGGGNTPGSMPFLSCAGAVTPVPQTTLRGNWSDLLSDASNDSAYHVLANQVFRMEVCYLLKPYTKPDGTLVAARYSVFPFSGVDAAHNAPNGFQDVSAIVVAIAILDNTSRKKAPNIGPCITAMNAKLDDAAESDYSGAQPNLMAGKWLKATQSSDFAPPGAPKSIGAQVRVYQRYFSLQSLVTP